MLLIDATNLNAGGGRSLLVYLLQELSEYPHHVLVSERACLPDSKNTTTNSLTNPLGASRQKLLEETVEKFKPETVLCLGNLPPRKRLRARRTITYFHNRALNSVTRQ